MSKSSAYSHPSRLVGLSSLVKCLLLGALWLRVNSISSQEFSDDTVLKKDNLFQSMWEAFKQNLEASKTAPRDSSSSFQGEYASTEASTSSPNRRVLLMKKTVEDHFFKNQGATHHDDSIYRELDCLMYTETSESYWSFRWCPKVAIFQGRLGENSELDQQIILGKYSDREGFEENADDFASKFHMHLSLLFPQASLELYTDGDLCDDSGRRRLAVTIIHDKTSQLCPNANENPFIVKMEEPQACTYLMHVCDSSSRWQARSSKKHTDSAENQHNQQSRDSIFAAINIYLRQTGEQDHHTSNPDRIASLHLGLPPIPPSRIGANLRLIKDMFIHAYDSYMYNAYPASEVKPLSCKPAVFSLVRVPALTLIDSLDTLIILGNYTEFARAVERLRVLHEEMAESNRFLDRKGGLFALNQNVSVFETTIRVLGGLLSAHQLAEATISSKVLESDVWDEDKAVLIGDSSKLICSSAEGRMEVEEDSTDFSSSLLKCRTVRSEETTCKNHTSKNWKYDGFLLELAQDIGDRLLPAFATRTGIPYGTVNLLSGIPKDETTIASLAGGGTLSLEMELLSRLTGNLEYGKAAKLAARALWMRRSKFNTFGKHICTKRGEWTEHLSGIGSNSDSFYEYLIKHYILFPEDQDFWFQLHSAYGGVHNESRLGDWYGDVDLNKGLSTGGGAVRVFEALMAFYPGLQILLGELAPAAGSLNSFFLVREFLGFLPERFNFGAWKVEKGGGTHFLRPELLESAYFLHRATKGFQHQLPVYSNNTDGFSGWQWAADYALHTLDSIARSKCGFASLGDVSPLTTGSMGLGTEGGHTRANRLDVMPSYFLSETLKYLYLTFDERNIVHSDDDRDWIFTTEAHPIHHVDLPSEGGKEERLKSQTTELIKRLRSRIQGGGKKRPLEWNVLNDEKWTDGSPLEFFIEQMEPIVDQSVRFDAPQSSSYNKPFTMTEPILSNEKVYPELDFFHETQNGLNDAHLAIRKTGNSVSLSKSCPNFHSPELFWVRALNGGSTDYSNAFASSIHDAMPEANTQFLMMGSFDALAWHGSGLHVAQGYDISHFCPVKDTTGKSAKSNVEPQQDKKKNVNLFNGGELGNFEIAAFPGGAGFSIKHIESGEQFVTSLIQELRDESGTEVETYLMVHSVSFQNNKVVPATQPGTEHDSNVAMGDLNGNMYVCQVEIIQKIESLESHHEDHAGDSPNVKSERVLARYPCAPALFGPTHFEELAQTGGIVTEAPLQAPAAGDESGCNDTADPSARDISNNEDESCEETSDDSDEEFSIQVVKRGLCAFQDKAMNQKSHAKAVIVVNTDKHELFVMSGGASKPNLSNNKNFPPTVLVSGSDGEAILSFASFFNSGHDDGSRLLSRLSIVRENTELKEGKKLYSITGNRFWPVVHASPDGIKVFSKHGWGVHAGQKSNTNANGSIEWQLYLVKHGQEEESEVTESETQSEESQAAQE